MSNISHIKDMEIFGFYVGEKGKLCRVFIQQILRVIQVSLMVGYGGQLINKLAA
ncbi:hypothetical protein VB715_10620 [Crocosphaera sp. UHCC 0190]|uniref:hypothetical protein n=1 Tax=Crocosphaera sp. UHCC 0190 TaxID=3110246 RepID=UPI002B1E9C01|nr:hypothetical protein [Crocosphaera sp. UHCC 0190]MEA5510215.1 hypothetical protein [Crocosphaera sp. UHCC 0190]